MTDLASVFDVLPTVTYISTKSLFHRKYPFKVLLIDPTPPVHVRNRINGLNYNQPSVVQAHEAFREARRKFMTQRLRIIKRIGVASADWRWSDNGHSRTLSYFFLNAADALAFIEKNKKYVSTVERPDTNEQIAAMRSHHTHVVREDLFWGRYRYCIEFRNTPEANAHVDEWVALNFEGDPDRAMYNSKAGRKLFLMEELDTVYAKMGCGEYFKKISKVILKAEINPDAYEPESGPQAD